MTKEMAIEILRECVTSGRAITNGCHINDTEYEVLKIAIKALEQNAVLQKENEDFRNYINKANHTNSQLIQLIEKHKINKDTSDDCVSRQAVITIIQNHWWNCKDIDTLVKALSPVTPTFPKGATNGDMIKAMFPNQTISCAIPITDWNGAKVYRTTINGVTDFTEDWWNAQYKGIEND